MMYLLLSKTDLVGTTLTINDKEAKKKQTNQNKQTKTGKKKPTNVQSNLHCNGVL